VLGCSSIVFTRSVCVRLHRLAEAYAEKIHLDMRREYWGYAKTEELDAVDLHKAWVAACLRCTPGA
jgi:cobalamin-dependent methionine synthase I